ncbi:helix-turn-helix transcriptional regulator [Flexivirga meconopsidis]|uniref:helix-turn-helix transcriptional regulator n=1 Tax=Flexivirga meconopsidis TaxID=2977121 RepID=UPI00223FFCB1|nr:YafY family protein [Flexivirga meconopsidis]
MTTPGERMLRLLSLLQSGRHWSAADLARAMDVPTRTLRRDIGQLRAMGYPVESTRGPGGHYRLIAGASLPPLMLDDDEAVAAVLGLQLAAAGATGIESAADAADRAGEKLRRVLPASLRRRTDDVFTAVEFAPAGQPQTHTAVLNTLAHAISVNRTTRFAYRAASGVITQREVEPIRLVQLRGRWYLFAWDRDRGDWRNFRLDRVAEARTLAETFTPRSLPSEDLPAYLRGRFFGPSNVRVVLVLGTDVRDAVSRLHRVDGTLEAIDDQCCRYTALVDSFEWLVTVLIMTDLDFTVLEPDEFREFLRRTAHRLEAATSPPAASR